MVTVTGYTAAYMQSIIDGTIVSASIVGEDLIFTKHDGSTFNAGSVIAPELSELFIRLVEADLIGLAIGVIGETYDRINIRPDRISMASPNRAPFEGSHTVGAVGIGSDNQIYIEALSKIANLLHIQAARPGTIPKDQPAIVGSPSFPMTLGSITVDDASEIPSTDAGPQALGKGYLVAPGFSDSFTRANSSTTMGSPWVPQNTSVWGINSNKAYCVTGGTPSQVLYDTGSSRHRMTVTTSGSGADLDGSGIIFSYVDSSNYIFARYNNSFVTWNVYKVVAGVQTFLFNAGSLISPNLTISAEYKDGIVSVSFGDSPPATSIQSFTAGTKCGFMTPNAGPTGATVRWDDFSVQSEFIATWTGKTSNTLTGFTCTTATGTADSTWAVWYRDGTRKILTRWSDGYNAPIGLVFDYGGVHFTDDVSMGALLPQDVGMVFGNTKNRTNPGLVLFGDDPVVGSGDDARKGMMLRRLSAGIANFGARFLIRPADLTSSSGVGSVGSALHPHLAIGEDGNGFYFGAPGVYVAVNDISQWAFLSSGFIPAFTNTVDIGSSTNRVKDLYIQGKIEWHDGFGNSLNMKEVTSSPAGTNTAPPGSLRADTNGYLWLKATGTGTSGWVKVRDENRILDVVDISSNVITPLSGQTIPVASNLAQALTGTLAGSGAFDRAYIGQSMFSIPSGYKVQAKAVAHVKGHTAGDSIGISFFDYPTSSAVMAETANVTTTTVSAGENVERVSTAWNDVPATAWQGAIQLRNTTASRGTILGMWIETRLIPV